MEILDALGATFPGWARFIVQELVLWAVLGALLGAVAILVVGELTHIPVRASSAALIATLLPRRRGKGAGRRALTGAAVGASGAVAIDGPPLAERMAAMVARRALGALELIAAIVPELATVLGGAVALSVAAFAWRLAGRGPPPTEGATGSRPRWAGSRASSSSAAVRSPRLRGRWRSSGSQSRSCSQPGSLSSAPGGRRRSGRAPPTWFGSRACSSR